MKINWKLKLISIQFSIPEKHWGRGAICFSHNTWHILFFGGDCPHPIPILKGKFPQTISIGWVESDFRNRIAKCWENLDNPFKRTNYAKFCIAPSLGRTLPECDTMRKRLSIDFVQRFSKCFNFSCMSIVWLIKFNHKCMHNYYVSPKHT